MALSTLNSWSGSRSVDVAWIRLDADSQGVGIANVVANREEVVGWGEQKKLRSAITYDDGEHLLRSTLKSF
jgi:hypothetical protein